MVKDGNSGVRSVARWLALVLMVGAVLAALNGAGFACMLRIADGYADFGYVPEECATSRSSARAINGEKVRVCQDAWSTTSGCYVGHESYPIGDAIGRMHSRCRTRATCARTAPDTRARTTCDDRSPSRCSTACSRATRSAADSFSAGDNGPIPGRRAERRASSDGARLHAASQITEHDGEHAADASAGLDLVLRLRHPDVDDRRPAALAQVSNPDAGGSVTLGESTYDGSPAVAGYTSGDWQRRTRLRRPAAAALDNTLHRTGSRTTR